jgi:hypothetical protein
MAQIGDREAMNPYLLIPLALVFAVALLLTRNEVMKRRLRCPRDGRDAKVGVVLRWGDPKRTVGVRSCDLLPNPRKVDCDQACLRAPV